MAAILRKCKECGKMFTPKGREQYCSDIHYRPCPVCGKPVIAKYLSDPARRCEDCRGKKVPTPAEALQTVVATDMKPEVAQSAKKAKREAKDNEVFIANIRLTPSDIKRIIDMGYPVISATSEDVVGYEHRWVYVGVPTKKGFQPGHEYNIKLDKDAYSYVVRSDEDITDQESIEIYDRFSSIISLNRNFVRSTPPT